MGGISGQLKIGLMYLAIKICICYNAGRQSDRVFHAEQRRPRRCELLGLLPILRS